MVNCACAFSQSETEKYFEGIIKSVIGFIILQLGDITSFNQDNSEIFLVKKMYNEVNWGVYYLRIREKTFS